MFFKIDWVLADRPFVEVKGYMAPARNPLPKCRPNPFPALQREINIASTSQRVRLGQTPTHASRHVIKAHSAVSGIGKMEVWVVRWRPEGVRRWDAYELCRCFETKQKEASRSSLLTADSHELKSRPTTRATHT